MSYKIKKKTSVKTDGLKTEIQIWGVYNKCSNANHKIT